MKIAKTQIIESNDWLCREILCSIPTEVLKDSMESTELDIKIVINGVECEPKMFVDMLNKYESIVDREAQILLKKEMDKIDEKVSEKMSALESVMMEAKSLILKEFNITEED